MQLVFRTRRQSTSRLQRRSRDLMSLASLAAFVAGSGWLVIATGLILEHARVAESGTTRLLALFHWLPPAHADYRMLALAWLVGSAATLAPLLALRRLGKSLWLGPVPSPDVAQRFRTLAHTLLFNLLGGSASAMLASMQTGQYRVNFGMGTWGLLVAILLAYIVAELVREGAAATAENREFV